MFPQRRCVKDIMLSVDSYPVVYVNDTVKSALHKLQQSLTSHQHKRRSLLVLNNAKDKEPMGWVAMGDILSLMQPESMQQKSVGGWDLSAFYEPSTYFSRELVNMLSDDSWDSMIDKCKKVSDINISKLVRPLESEAVQVRASLKTAAAIMSDSDVSTLPVIENDKVVGFVRAEDLVLEMANAASQTSLDEEQANVVDL